MSPVEGRAGVGLTPGGNVAVPDDSVRRNAGIVALQCLGHHSQLAVLRGGIGDVIRALELNTNTEVIAVFPA